MIDDYQVAEAAHPVRIHHLARGDGSDRLAFRGDGFLSIYGNNESLLKQTGDTVTLGETVATVGQSGGNEETGLYFEMRFLGKPFDPLSWVKLK